MLVYVTYEWFVMQMLTVCVRGVMDVVFSVCIVMRGSVGARVCVLYSKLLLLGEAGETWDRGDLDHHIYLV